MNISEILRIGATIGAPFFPPLAAVIPVINALLPDDEKLPDTATGATVSAALQKLPPDQQLQLLDSEIDLEKTKVVENTKVVQTLADVDKSGNSTRPGIAKGFAQVICFVIILMVTMWAYAVMTDNPAMLKTIQNGWQMILAVTVPPLAVIRAYFGMRTEEKNTRQLAARGLNSPLKGFANLISAFKGK